MNNQGMQMFCSRRNQAGLIHEVQIAVINGEITSVKYILYVQDSPESYEAKKGDEDFWEKVSMAVFFLACEPKVHNDMWDALSPESVEILGSHDIFRDGILEKFERMTPEELAADLERRKAEDPMLRQYCKCVEENRCRRHECDDGPEETLTLDEVLAEMGLTLEAAMDNIPSTDPILRWIKGKSLL